AIPRGDCLLYLAELLNHGLVRVAACPLDGRVRINAPVSVPTLGRCFGNDMRLQHGLRDHRVEWRAVEIGEDCTHAYDIGPLPAIAVSLVDTDEDASALGV